MELKLTNHSFYCSDSNYYAGKQDNFGQTKYYTWSSFKRHMFNKDLTVDHNFHNLNHCFRFDIENRFDEFDGTEIPDEYTLKLYYIYQRKGIFWAVEIDKITEYDMPEIETYLKSCWEYLKNQWREIDN